MSGDVPVTRLVVTGLLCLAAVAMLMAVTAVVVARARKHSVVDVVWGLGFAVVALVAGSASLVAGEADAGRRALVVAMTVLWGSRLAVHIAVRNAGQDDDPRYLAMFRGQEPSIVEAVAKVYVPQGLAMWFVSLPVQVAVHHDDGMGVIGWAGVAVWLVGFAFESIGDAQLARFKKTDPANRGAVMDRGLWRYTRHPNYFGDACVWWGLFLVAAERWPGLLTVLSPLAMTYLLVAKSGKALLERSLQRSKPGYADYVARTSGFFPLPPRRGER